MRRERGELPSSSSSNNNPQRLKHDDDRYPKLCLMTTNRDPIDRLMEEDIRDMLPQSIKVLEVHICRSPPSIFVVLDTLNDLFKAMDCLQGKSPRSFPKLRFNVSPGNETVALFDLGKMVLHGLPLLMNNRDDPIQLVERFITQTEPRAQFAQNLIPSGIIFLRRNNAGMCFVYFNSSADAEEAIRVLNNKPFDPTSQVSDENQVVRTEMAKSTQQQQQHQQQRHQDDRNEGRFDRNANEGRFGTRDGRSYNNNRDNLGTNKSNYNDGYDDYAADRNRRRMGAEHHNEQQRAYSYSEDADRRRRADPRYQDDDRSQYHRTSAAVSSSLPDPRRNSSSTMLSTLDQRRQQFTDDGPSLHYAVMVSIIQRQLLPEHIDTMTQDLISEEIQTFLGERLRKRCFRVTFKQGACFMHFHSLGESCDAVTACQYQASTFCRGGLYKANLTTQTKDAFGIVTVRIRNLPLSFESIPKTNEFVQDQLSGGRQQQASFIPELTYMFDPMVPWRDRRNSPELRQMFLEFTSEAAAKHCCDVLDGLTMNKLSNAGEILEAEIFLFGKK